MSSPWSVRRFSQTSGKMHDGFLHAASISLDAATYGELERGELAAQDAFLTGRVEVKGDMQMAIQLALAALAPD